MQSPISEEQLKSLLGFYDQYGNDVAGHECEAPDSDTITHIEQFVSGDLSEEQFDDFFALVADNPKSLALVAEKLLENLGH